MIVGKRQAEQLFTDNVQNYQNNDMSAAIRQSYRTFLMSDVDSPDIYLALAQIQKQIQDGILVTDFQDTLIERILQVLDESESVLVNARCAKLLQQFCVMDDARRSVLKNLLENGYKLEFPKVMYKIFTRRCINASPRHNMILSNDELILSVCALLDTVLGNQFVGQNSACGNNGAGPVIQLDC